MVIIKSLVESFMSFSVLKQSLFLCLALAVIDHIVHIFDETFIKPKYKDYLEKEEKKLEEEIGKEGSKSPILAYFGSVAYSKYGICFWISFGICCLCFNFHSHHTTYEYASLFTELTNFTAVLIWLNVAVHQVCACFSFQSRYSYFLIFLSHPEYPLGLKVRELLIAIGNFLYVSIMIWSHLVFEYYFWSLTTLALSTGIILFLIFYTFLMLAVLEYISSYNGKE